MRERILTGSGTGPRIHSRSFQSSNHPHLHVSSHVATDTTENFVWKCAGSPRPPELSRSVIHRRTNYWCKPSKCGRASGMCTHRSPLHSPGSSPMLEQKAVMRFLLRGYKFNVLNEKSRWTNSYTREVHSACQNYSFHLIYLVLYSYPHRTHWNVCIDPRVSTLCPRPCPCRVHSVGAHRHPVATFWTLVSIQQNRLQPLLFRPQCPLPPAVHQREDETSAEKLPTSLPPFM